MGRTIAVANQKGGVGKTPTDINLGAALALDGHSTLLIDLDPQGSTTTGLGMRAAGISGTTYELLVEGRSAVDLVQHTAIEGLDLLPSTRELVGAEVELVAVAGREQKLHQAPAPGRGRDALRLLAWPPSLR